MITELNIEKPFSTHTTTLKEMYVVEGFQQMMMSLIECVRREIADNEILDLGTLRLRQGELKAYKKILARSKQAYEDITKIIKVESLHEGQKINEQGENI